MDLSREAELSPLLRAQEGSRHPSTAHRVGRGVLHGAASGRARLARADRRLHLPQLAHGGVARSLFGLAALVPDQVDRRVVADALGKAVDQGLATDPWLWWLLDKRRCRGRNGVTCFESVLAERVRLGPTESWLERELLTVIRAAGLPKPTTQKVIRRSGRFAARVDMIYDAERAPGPRSR